MMVMVVASSMNDLQRQLPVRNSTRPSEVVVVVVAAAAAVVTTSAIPRTMIWMEV